ncbi:Exonuclease 1 [Orchesella cincta]|uniref:Exonuclease 1 n=1 Tax=Orchesella cincta TaxID=48709 RepID=A0A1D2MKM1_ORCCI|nr:Exonuclease 1 [Orchesella cincta]
MGITGLLPLLKKASRNCNVRKFSGYTVAIDGYCWLHKGAFGCAEKLGKGEPTTAYITYCMKYINVLLDNNIKPILVLDGRNLPSKAHTEKKRREKREENRKLARKYLQEGNRKGAWECFTKCVDITPAMAREFIKELRRLNIDYVVAPHEADAQLAYMARKGIADMIITEDSDLVLFGCPKIFFKMNVNGDGVYFEDTKIPQSLGVKPNQYTFERFRWMCILSGCDYLPSIPGIGLGRAKKVIFSTTEEDITKIILSIPSVLDQVDEVPEGYIDGFIQAENTFLYQLVFDTITRTVIPLTPYPDTVNPEDLGYAGRYESKQLAIGLALGNVDLHNLNFVDNFEPLKSVSPVGFIYSSNRC